MIVKKSVQCGECKKYIDVYIEERKSMKNMTISCKCGNRQVCVEYNRFGSKWKRI